MRRLNKLLLCSIALVASLATGLYLNAKESQMPKKIMMYYGGFEVEEMFDASQWFVSGMYKPRNIEADGGASNVTMLRSQLRPFTPEQLAERLRGCPAHDPLMTLRELCIEAIENLARDQQKRRIFTILLRRCEFTEELREAEERHEAFINLFIALCEQQFSAPSVASRLHPGLSPRLAARAVHALIVGLFHDWLRDPNLFDPLSDAAPMIDACFRGLIRDWPDATVLTPG